jgi:hypothetical protein
VGEHSREAHVVGNLVCCGAVGDCNTLDHALCGFAKAGSAQHVVYAVVFGITFCGVLSSAVCGVVGGVVGSGVGGVVLNGVSGVVVLR